MTRSSQVFCVEQCGHGVEKFSTDWGINRLAITLGEVCVPCSGRPFLRIGMKEKNFVFVCRCDSGCPSDGGEIKLQISTIGKWTENLNEIRMKLLTVAQRSATLTSLGVLMSRSVAGGRSRFSKQSF